MKKTLYITEKPSQIQSLKAVLKGSNIRFSALAGHILEMLKPNEYDPIYSNWYKAYTDNKLPFLQKEYVRKVKAPSQYKASDGKMRTTDYKKMFEAIKLEIDACDEIIIASDPDNEGANLALEVIKACKAEDKIKGMVNMAKLDSDSLTEALKDLDSLPYSDMSDAAEIRAIFDYLFGMNNSMGGTVMLGGGETIHIGGVKTPILSMVVNRDLEVESHKKVPFWEFEAKVKDPKTGITFPINIKYKGDTKFDQESAAKEALKILSRKLKVTNYREKNSSSVAPLLYSLSDLGADAARLYKFSIKKTDGIAQKLYDMGIQSYPRTDENYLPKSQHKDAAKITNHLSQHKDFSGIKLTTPFRMGRAFDDDKLDGVDSKKAPTMTPEQKKEFSKLTGQDKKDFELKLRNEQKGKSAAHTALAPTMKSVDLSTLSEDEKKIYLLVAKRYYAQFMDDYKYLDIKIDADHGDFQITAGENVEISKGWKELQGSDKGDKTIRNLPVLNIGDDLEITSINIKEKATKPKSRFNQGTLLKAMQNIASIYDDPIIKEHLGTIGIGTPATRNITIESLLKGGYLKMEGNNIVSTEKARKLIANLPDEITNPLTRAKLEQLTKKVAKGEISFEDAKEMVENTTVELYNSIVEFAKNLGYKPHQGSPTGNISGKPSVKMVKLANDLAKNINVKLSKETLASKGELMEFINANKNNLNYEISDKQKNILIQVNNPKVKELLDKKTHTREEYDFLNGEVGKFFEGKMTKLSPLQRKILEDTRNDVPKGISKLIEDKQEFKKEDWEKIQKTLGKIMDGFKAKNLDRN